MEHRHIPPLIDMTPEGEFRQPAPRPATWLDKALGRVGGVALLVAVLAGGLMLAALAVLFVGLILPVLLVAGLIGVGSIWWRLRRMRRQGGVPFFVVRR